MPSLTATKEPDNTQKRHRIRMSREERDEKTRAKEAALTAGLETELPLQTSATQFMKYTIDSLLRPSRTNFTHNYFPQNHLR